MKEIIKETKSTYKVYQAVDGVEFDTKTECEKYEKSARCVVFSKYKPLVKSTISEYNLFTVGNEEYMVDVVYLSHGSDIDTIIQLVSLHSYKEVDDYSQLRIKLGTALQNNDAIFIGRGFEFDNYDQFYIFGTLSEHIEHITKIAQNEIN